MNFWTLWLLMLLMVLLVGFEDWCHLLAAWMKRTSRSFRRFWTWYCRATGYEKHVLETRRMNAEASFSEDVQK